MLKRRLLIFACIFGIAIAAVSPAAANKAAATEGNASLPQTITRLQQLAETTSRPQLKSFIEDALADSGAADAERKLAYALKVATDVEGSELWTNSPFVVYEVPALSPEKRLPDSLPSDGAVSDSLRVVSAQDEYEASSFVLAPLRDASSVSFHVGDLQGEGGTIPASAVDMHVVKTWYQGGTAWQSYFYDATKDVLTPELLLHDESLILVDHAQKKNFLRVDYPTGSQYVDVFTKPAKKFDHLAEPVADSPTLLPIALKQGESKQMWVTTKVPAGTPEGIYTGTIGITADGVPAGELELKIRVLPFELPDPKTYYNLDKDFYVMLYHESRVKEYMDASGGNSALVDEKLLNTYRNMAEHNAVNIPGPIYRTSEPQHFIRQIELMRQAGLDLDPLFGVAPAFAPYHFFNEYNSYVAAKAAYEANPTETNRLKMEQHYNNWRTGIETHKTELAGIYDAVTDIVGHSNLYFDGWDEAGWSLLQWQQEMWKYAKEELGVNLFATGHDSHLDLEVKQDFLNWVGDPTREKAAAWHAFGEEKRITNYAYPHTGPENPDLMRQRHGMWLYKANYDATYNYIYYENFLNTWNDEIDGTFRALNLVYPTKTDIIDTLAWEGFREGIDDIRYATKLKQLAAEAAASGDPERAAAANKALTWLEATDERSTNADLIRLEMIHHITKLIDLADAE
ncbi:hypothetical protein FE782_15430 [Paenibacillus antri]|uniref:DUF4091 domain-containing protein n=1 Tax=Paenibacillus antri TaxID=2582848 RepID=A0A5R9G8U9_9BACL|nr:hypothetical protein [Paenibacillus antri]TLS51499.1 hypothetical protein FE782_15430 [Paenibacillus antri]